MAFVLDPPTHPVDAPVGDPHHMERVGHRDGMVEMGSGSGPVALGQVGRDDPDGPRARPDPGSHTIGAGRLPRSLPPGR